MENPAGGEDGDWNRTAKASRRSVSKWFAQWRKVHHTQFETTVKVGMIDHMTFIRPTITYPRPVIQAYVLPVISGSHRRLRLFCDLSAQLNRPLARDQNYIYEPEAPRKKEK